MQTANVIFYSCITNYTDLDYVTLLYSVHCVNL